MGGEELRSPERQGNALIFTCPFHAWTYDTKGCLVGAGFQHSPEAYAGTLPKHDWGLAEVAQFKNFYGSLWATWDPKAPSFEEYLGPFTESLRHCLQSSDGVDGGLDMFSPFQRHRLPTNWKVPGFTSVTDLTHTAMTHRSAAAAGLHQDRGTLGGRDRRRKANPFPMSKYAIGDHNLGHGGMCTLYQQPGVPEYENEWYEEGVDDYFSEACDRKAKLLVDKIMPPHGWGGGHFAIFPCGQLAAALVEPPLRGRRRALDALRRRQDRAEARAERRPPLLGALQRPRRLLRVGRHGELELRLPRQPGREGAEAGLLLRQRTRARRVQRQDAGRRIQRLLHGGGPARASAGGSPSWRPPVETTSTLSASRPTTASGRGEP